MDSFLGAGNTEPTRHIPGPEETQEAGRGAKTVHRKLKCTAEGVVAQENGIRWLLGGPTQVQLGAVRHDDIQEGGGKEPTLWVYLQDGASYQ